MTKGKISRLYLALFAVLSIVTIPTSAKAQDSTPDKKQRELEYAYPDQSVWTTKTDERGDPENPLLRLAAAMFEKAGIAWHSKRYPAARMFNYLNDGTAEFSMLVNSPALQDCCLLSKAPVASTELRVYRIGDKESIRTKEDLIGKRVITIRGYSYGGILNFISDPANNITNNAAIRHEAAFAMLEAGRGDYLLDYAGPAIEVLNTKQIPSVRFDKLSKLEVFLILAKAYPNSAAVMARLEAIVETLNKEEIIGVPLR